MERVTTAATDLARPDRRPDRCTPTVRLPGSKSMTARALVLAALADGPSTLRPPLRARDTELMAAGLARHGRRVSTSRIRLAWVVRPRPLPVRPTIDVGLAGTVMRFLPPVAALADGRVTFDGDSGARKRPLGPLLAALRDSASTSTPADRGRRRPAADRARSRPVARRRGHHRRVGVEPVRLRAAARGRAFDRGLVGPPRRAAGAERAAPADDRRRCCAPPAPTVDDTTPDVWAVAPGQLAGRDWTIEPDLSGAAPFLAAAMVTGGEVTVPGWPREHDPAGRPAARAADRDGRRRSPSPTPA